MALKTVYECDICQAQWNDVSNMIVMECDADAPGAIEVFHSCHDGSCLIGVLGQIADYTAQEWAQVKLTNLRGKNER